MQPCCKWCGIGCAIILVGIVSALIVSVFLAMEIYKDRNNLPIDVLVICIPVLLTTAPLLWFRVDERNRNLVLPFIPAAIIFIIYAFIKAILCAVDDDYDYVPREAIAFVFILAWFPYAIIVTFWYYKERKIVDGPAEQNSGTRRNL